MRDSKFGPALVVETSPRSGGYILGKDTPPDLVILQQTWVNLPYSNSPPHPLRSLYPSPCSHHMTLLLSLFVNAPLLPCCPGFRIDPNDRLMSVHKELASLHQIFSVNPIFGVDFVVEDKVRSPLHVTSVCRHREGAIFICIRQSAIKGQPPCLHALIAVLPTNTSICVLLLSCVWCQAQSLEAVTAERVEDDVEIINNDDHKDAAALYFADRYSAQSKKRTHTRGKRENAHAESNMYTNTQTQSKMLSSENSTTSKEGRLSLPCACCVVCWTGIRRRTVRWSSATSWA